MRWTVHTLTFLPHYGHPPMCSPVDASISNGEAWPIGRCLQVGEEMFDVVYNPPTIDKARRAQLLSRK